MKKIISYILLLAMCLTIFAGCAPKEDADLIAAKDYLYAMYKDTATKTNVDYTVVSQVVVGDNTYPITWTADVAEDLVKIVASENNMTTIDINEAPEEEVNYTLTATLTNKDGQTQSVSFKYMIPAVKKAEVGESATIFYPADSLYVTGTEYTYTSSSGSTKVELTLSANKADAVALTVQKNDDGTVSFVAGGKYLFCDATHVKFVDVQDDNTKFVLEPTGDGNKVFIKCAVANYNGKPQYLEVYSGYLTCYGMQEAKAEIYTFELQDTTGAGGVTIPSTPDASTPATPDASTPAPTTPGTPAPTTPTTPPATNPPATNPPATGSKVVMSFVKDNQFVTGKHYQYTSKSGNVKMELEMSDKKADALAMEMITNGDSTVSFKSGTQYLFCDGNDVKFVSSQSDNTKFVLENANGGYFIKCATANYQGKAQYLEVYGGYLTCYSMGSDATIYTFKLDSASGANGAISAQDGSNNNGSGSGSTTTPTTPAAPPAAVNGKKAASIDMKGTTTLKSCTGTQTVHEANGIKYTNDKASSTTANYSGQSTYSARAYQGSTVKIEYTGMVAIVLNLDDYSNGDKTYMAGFDDMTVSGATITRSGTVVTITFASATNVFQSAELASQTRINSIDVYTAN